MKMVEDAYYNQFFIVDVIVSDNDSTMQSMLKNPLIGFRVQVLNSCKVKIDEKIPESSFLADLSHRVRFVAKHIFSIVNKRSAQRFGCTKSGALQLKKYWGYTIKIIGKKTIEELSEASNAPLENMFNSHANCSVEWCFKTREPEERKTYNDKDNEFRYKQNDNQLYNLL